MPLDHPFFFSQEELLFPKEEMLEYSFVQAEECIDFVSFAFGVPFEDMTFKARRTIIFCRSLRHQFLIRLIKQHRRLEQNEKNRREPTQLNKKRKFFESNL